MQLSKPQIQRIDSFLERLGCEYIDIRYEMVDHIATDIENKVTNYNNFFQKDGMRGQFLGYMMRKKKELQKNYAQQSKKMFWSNFGVILKQILYELINVKVLLFIFITILTFRLLFKISVFYAGISSLVLVIVSAMYFYYIHNKEVKKYGRLRTLHTFYFLSYMFLIFSNPLYNFIHIIKHKDDELVIILYYFYVGYFIFNTLLTLVFIKYKNHFINQFKHII